MEVYARIGPDKGVDWKDLSLARERRNPRTLHVHDRRTGSHIDHAPSQAGAPPISQGDPGNRCRPELDVLGVPSAPGGDDDPITPGREIAQVECGLLHDCRHDRFGASMLPRHDLNLPRKPDQGAIDASRRPHLMHLGQGHYVRATEAPAELDLAS